MSGPGLNVTGSPHVRCHRLHARLPFVLLASLSLARAESSNLGFGGADLTVLEAISARVPGFAGVVRVVPTDGGTCLRLGSVFSRVTGPTLEAVRRSGIFDPERLCPDVEVVTYSLRTLTRVAREVTTVMPELQVQVDTGLNRVLVSNLPAVTARMPDLTRYLVGAQDLPAYDLILTVQGTTPVVTVVNPLKRRIAVEPFACAAVVQVWQGTKVLNTLPDMACALSGSPVILQPGERMVLPSVASTPLDRLPAGTYALRVTTQDRRARTTETTWIKR